MRNGKWEMGNVKLGILSAHWPVSRFRFPVSGLTFHLSTVFRGNDGNRSPRFFIKLLTQETSCLSDLGVRSDPTGSGPAERTPSAGPAAASRLRSGRSI